MSSPTAWITGAGGFIGSHLMRSAAEHAPGWNVIPITRDRVDLQDFVTVDRYFATDRPRLIIHCAAMSRVGDCEANPSLAYAVNVAVTTHLTELAFDIPLIFLSTDLVFDGLMGGYVETDPVNPVNVYAETKVQAEEQVMRNPLHTVVRTSLNAGISPMGNRSFTEDMHRAWQRGQTLSLFMDEFRNPIHVSITARAIWALALMSRPGVYHLAGAERLSRWEIGQLLAERWTHLETRMGPASLGNYQGTKRPPDTSLDCAKLQGLLDFRLEGLGEWMKSRPIGEV